MNYYLRINGRRSGRERSAHDGTKPAERYAEIHPIPADSANVSPSRPSGPTVGSLQQEGAVMAGGCRDCGTCTKPGFARMGQDLGVGFMHLMTVGISWLVKRGGMSHCPQCKHLRSNHRTRADGSYID